MTAILTVCGQPSTEANCKDVQTHWRTAYATVCHNSTAETMPFGTKLIELVKTKRSRNKILIPDDWIVHVWIT